MKIFISGGSGFIGAYAHRMTMRVHKYDVFISAARSETEIGAHLVRLLREAAFAPRLMYPAADSDERSGKRVVINLRRSASCALVFGPSGESPLADERLRAAIRLRFEQMRGDFRPIPVVYLKGEPPPVKFLSDELRGIDCRPPVFFGDAIDERESLRRLILGIRGVDSEPRDAWEFGWLRQQVRSRAENALNVDWAKLASEVSRPAAADYMVPSSANPGTMAVTRTPSVGYVQHLSHAHWFKSRYAPLPRDVHLQAQTRDDAAPALSRAGGDGRRFGYSKRRGPAGIFQTLKGYVADLLRGFGFGVPRARASSLLPEHAWLKYEAAAIGFAPSYGRPLLLNLATYLFPAPSLSYKRAYRCRTPMLLCCYVNKTFLSSEGHRPARRAGKVFEQRCAADDFTSEFEMVSSALDGTREFPLMVYDRETRRRGDGRSGFTTAVVRCVPELVKRDYGSMLVVPLRHGVGAERELLGVLTCFDSYGDGERSSDAPRYMYVVDGFDGDSLEEIAARLRKVLFSSRRADEQYTAEHCATEHVAGRGRTYAASISFLIRHLRPDGPDSAAEKRSTIWTPADARAEGRACDAERDDAEDSDDCEGRRPEIPGAGFYVYRLQPPA